MNTQNYSQFFNDCFGIDSARQALIDQYYSVVVDDIDRDTLLRDPLNFKNIVNSDRIIHILFFAINYNVFSLVIQLVDKTEVETALKHKVKNLCYQRIAEFKPQIKEDTRFFKNELDKVLVKGQTKNSVAENLLNLLLKN